MIIEFPPNASSPIPLKLSKHLKLSLFYQDRNNASPQRYCSGLAQATLGAKNQSAIVTSAKQMTW